MPRLKTKGQSCCWEASRVGEEAKQREEKRSDFCTGSPMRLLPGPDKRAAVPRARPRSGPRTQAQGPPSAWPSLDHFPWASSSAASGMWCSRAAKNKGLVRIQPDTGLKKHTQYRHCSRTRTELYKGPLAKCNLPETLLYHFTSFSLW